MDWTRCRFTFGNKALLVLVILFLGEEILSQDLRFKRLNIEDGLVSSSIVEMVQDSQGFLWIATTSGLSRYDGTEFYNYVSRDDNPCTLNDNYIRDLSIGPGGDVFAATPSGWSFLDRENQCFVSFPPDMGLAGDRQVQISSIHVDGNRTVWLGSDAGLLQYDFSADTTVLHEFALSQSPAFQVRSIAPDPRHEDRLIIGFHDGVCTFDMRNHQYVGPYFRPHSHWSSARVSDIGPLTDSILWFGFWGNGLGGLHVHSGEWSFYHSDRGLQHVDDERGNVPWDVVYDIMSLGDVLWIGFSDGMGILSRPDARMHIVEHDVTRPWSLSNSSVTAFAQTREGSIYVGTSNGLNVLSRHKPLIARIDPQNTSAIIKNLQEQRTSHGLFLYCARMPLDDGRVLYSDVVTGGVTILDPRNNTFQHIAAESGNRPEVFLDCARLNAETILLCTRDALFTFNLVKRTLQPFSGALQDTLHRMRMENLNMKTGPDGSIWIWDIQRITVLGNDMTVRTIQVGQYSRENIRLVVPFSGDRAVIVLGTHAYLVDIQGSGFHEMSMTSEFASTGRDGVLTGDEVWISTGGAGVYRCALRDDSLILRRHYTLANGLPANNVHCITVGPDGFIWGSTDAGIFRLDTTSENVRIYNQRDGIALPYIDEPVTFLANGLAFFDDRRYLYTLDPAVDNTFKGTAYINAITTSDSVYYSFRPEHVRLAPHENSLTISMGVLDHVYGDRDDLFYTMEGFDEEWQKSGIDRSARYTNLSPGRYTFRVYARSPDGLKSEEAAITFSITPTLHQRIWFVPLLIAMGLTGIYLFYRWRLRSIRKTEEERAEYNRRVAELELTALRSQMNPHFMFNSLNSIKTYILKAEPDKAAEYLSSFAHLIRMILQNAREKTVSLQDELDTLLLYIDLEKLRFREGFNLHCSIEDDVDLGRVLIPPMILQPYVENAIWHGLLHKEGERHLSLSFKKKNGTLICTIDDNGIGRKKAHAMKSKTATRYKSMGMGITHDRITLLNRMDALGIDISIIDKEGGSDDTGTTVKIAIPYEGNHH